SCGRQTSTQMLWRHTSGLAALWRMNSIGSRDTFVAVGPYSGWTARDLAAGWDGSSRLLYTSPSLTRIVKVAGTTPQIGPSYPVTAGWTPLVVAGGPSDKTQLLWTYTSGRISLW